jgi:hypothetical protein
MKNVERPDAHLGDGLATLYDVHLTDSDLLEASQTGQSPTDILNARSHEVIERLAAAHHIAVDEYIRRTYTEAMLVAEENGWLDTEGQFITRHHKS